MQTSFPCFCPYVLFLVGLCGLCLTEREKRRHAAVSTIREMPALRAALQDASRDSRSLEPLFVDEPHLYQLREDDITDQRRQ